MKNSFPKRVKLQSKNRLCDANAKFGDHGLYIYMYACICEEILYKNTIFELSIEIASTFSGMALNAFWKRALHVLYVCCIIH